VSASANGALAREIADYVAAQASAPLRLVEVAVDASKAVPVLRGRVLTTKQGAAVGEIARRHGARLAIEVVGDPEAGLEEGWLLPTGDKVEVWRGPDQVGEDRARQTEYLAADGPLRRLGDLAGALLVQGPDLTIGWVEEPLVRSADAVASRADWARRVRARSGEPVAPDQEARRLPGDLPEALITAGREALGTPYRWGGTTPVGYDCSGLVQRLFSLATGVLLPKHSGDQRQVGRRVTEGEAQAGDLLFAAPIGQRVGHVMLLTSSSTLLHACRTEGRVIEEPVEENAKRYQHQGYRRPVQF
jgi:hypothetical protein